MGLWNKLTNEFIDIIQWTDDSSDTMLYRFYRPDNEIKNGAQLIVREGQAAAFVNEGQLADVFLPGTYTLTTQNLPILSKLRGWKYGFESPFKAEVYFVSTRIFTDRKWGTPNPIMLRDAEFGMVRLRAFGTFAVRVKYPPVFLRELVSTSSQFTIDDIESQLRDLVTARFADAVGTSKIAALDLAGNYGQLSDFITAKIQPEFASFGLEIIKLLIENISLPAEVEAAMDKRTSMGVIGNLQAYAQYQTGNAIGDAAKNPGGLAGAGAGLGAGFAVAQQMGQAMNPASNTTPPPLPASSAASFFAVIDDKQAGPFDPPQIQQNIASGKFTRDTLVWQAGMQQWVPAASVPAMASLLGNSPPAIPKG
jgi:membrane protease subunit (stomatin/prohibitin family)